MVEYNIVEHMSFDWMIAAYFFLGGLSAGSYLFSVMANYWKKEFKPLALTAAVIAPLALAAGMLMLQLDLGQPLRAWRLFLTFNPTSALSWGIWFLNIFFLLSLIYAFLIFKGQEEKAEKFAYAGIPFAFLVASYTGILLAQSPGRALWHSPLLPVLFVIGGIISGIALISMLSAGTSNSSVSTGICKFLGWLVLLEVALTAIELIALSNGGAEAVAAANHLLVGDFSFLFWGVQIILGAIVPVLILFKGNVSPRAQAVAAMLVLIGIFAMRYIVVIGGQVATFS